MIRPCGTRLKGHYQPRGTLLKEQYGQSETVNTVLKGRYTGHVELVLKDNADHIQLVFKQTTRSM